MPPAFGREPKKTRKQLYLYHHTHFQVLSLSSFLSVLSQADDKWRKRSSAAGADGVMAAVVVVGITLHFSSCSGGGAALTMTTDSF